MVGIEEILIGVTLGTVLQGANVVKSVVNSVRHKNSKKSEDSKEKLWDDFISFIALVLLTFMILNMYAN